MRLILIIWCLGLALPHVHSEDSKQQSDITKLEVVELSDTEFESDIEDSESHAKRQSGYSYDRPNRFRHGGSSRFLQKQLGHRGKILVQNPSQLHRPFNKYGPPSHQNAPTQRPQGGHLQERPHHHKHIGNHQQNNQHSGNFDGHRGHDHLADQEVPSPIRNTDFVEPSPIAGQNNEPFGVHTANYLPPPNQKLPAYTTSDHFSPESTSHGQGHGNLQNQDIVQSQEQQISDAALFLSQNAQAIQQLYGAPATDQNYAPHHSANDQFSGQTNRVRQSNEQLRNLPNNPQGFPPLPSYASGTLNSQETLEQIQSLEKDRLIVQLQEALVAQAQTEQAGLSGRYAQNHASFVQNQEFLASIGAQMNPSNPKQPGLTIQQPGTSAFENAFHRPLFLPTTTTLGTTRFPLSYGLTPTTPIPITTTTNVASTTVAPIDASTSQPGQSSRDEGTTQVETSFPIPGQPGAPGFPVYGGFVPTLISGTSFLTNVPAYGSGVFAPGTVTTPVQSSGSSPTHFGLPIPTNHAPKPIPVPSSPSSPSSPSTPISTTPSTVQTSGRPVISSSLPLPSVPVSLHPLHPVVPLHPVHPVTTSLHPAPNPASVSPGHGLYGSQTPLINPLIYKHYKPVYPVYYPFLSYPNVYQLQKAALSAYPWSYASAYPQVKPAQIWK